MVFGSGLSTKGLPLTMPINQAFLSFIHIKNNQIPAIPSLPAGYFPAGHLFFGEQPLLRLFQFPDNLVQQPDFRGRHLLDFAQRIEALGIVAQVLQRMPGNILSLAGLPCKQVVGRAPRIIAYQLDMADADAVKLAARQLDG